MQTMRMKMYSISSFLIFFLWLQCFISIGGETNNDYAQWSSKKIDNNDDNKKKVAVVTLITTSEYIPGAEVLAYSLNRVNAIGDRILLYVGRSEDERSDLTPEHIRNLYLAGWNQTIALTKESGTYTECKVSEKTKKLIDSNSELHTLKRYWGTCSKIAAWTLTTYDTVVYIDADSLVLNNFDFVYDLIDYSKGNTLYAQGTPGCWDNPPNCDEFYSAFLVLKPLSHISKYFHGVAQKHEFGNGDIELFNALYKTWKPLPRYTMIAQTEEARPWIGIGSNNATVDWSVVKVYDFSGSPVTKPWNTYRLQKETNNKYAHGYIKIKILPNSDFFHKYMAPQWIWNEYYDAVLKEKEEKLDKAGFCFVEEGGSCAADDS